MMMLAIKDLLNPIQSNISKNFIAGALPRSPKVSGSDHGSHVWNETRRQAGLTATHQVALSPLIPNIHGPVNYPPFENVDDRTRQQIMAFNIPQFGSIRRTCEHIPYNSSKKDFFAKTGRESIEGSKYAASAWNVADAVVAFKYTFQIPRNPAVFTIMWDYNTGLVRMTPFFKCMGYPKARLRLTASQLDHS
jgi:hypothetical protein